MNQQEADQLLSKYLDNTASPEERALLENWYIHEADKRVLSDEDNFEHLAAELWAGARLRAGLTVRSKIATRWPRIAVAASVLFILSFGLFLLMKPGGTQHQHTPNKMADVTTPILTLADGKKVFLSRVRQGVFARQGNSVLQRSADGVLSYRPAAGQGEQVAVLYNSLIIPRGSGYQQLLLPDGTKVWINAASSLRYPTAFPGKERTVELNGEAYFEVAHNPSKPFHVVSKRQVVEVLGTHFNVNAYDDEPAVKTTLLEGKVKITAAADHAIGFLAPGQQSVLDRGALTVSPVDTNEAVAWKSGKFIFQHDHIQHIMRVIARWYNVKIEYSGKIPENSFSGTILRNKTISENLMILQLTGKVRFHIEGRQITVFR